MDKSGSLLTCTSELAGKAERPSSWLSILIGSVKLALERTVVQ